MSIDLLHSLLDGEERPAGPRALDELERRRPQRRRVPAHRRRRGLGAGYWTLWAATGVSSIGDGLVTIALPLLAVSVTHDGLALGGLLAALRLPWLFVALPLGAIADRVDRRRMAVMTEAIRTATLAFLAVAIGAGVHNLLFLYVTAFILGTLEAAFVAATSAAVPDLVPADRYGRANGHLNAANTAGEDLLGVGLGGLAFAAFAALPFLLDSASFAISGLLLLAALPHAGKALAGAGAQPTAGAQPAEAEGESAWDGLRYVFRFPALRVLMLTNAVLAFLQAMMMGVLVAFAITELHVTASGYGVMLSIAALGMVAGGVMAGRVVDRLGSATVLVFGAGGAGVAYLLLAYSTSAAPAVGALALGGFSVILGRTAITTLRHELVPQTLQARTNTLFRAVVYGVVPLGAVIGGLIAHVWSLQSAIVAAGVVEVLIVVVLARPILNRLSVTVDVRGPHEPAVVLPASGPGPSIGEALDRSRRGGELRRIEDLAEDLDQTVAPLALK